MQEDYNGLILKIRNGNLDSFKAFYNDFFPVLCTFAHKYCLSESDAKDIVQEAFLAFWSKRRDFNTINTARSFLYTCVKNKSLNFLRDNHLKQKVRIEQFSDNLFFENILEVECYDLLYNAFKVLSPKEKQVMELALDGINNPSIAKELNISVNSVKTMKKRSYNKLRNELQEYMEITALLYFLLHL